MPPSVEMVVTRLLQFSIVQAKIAVTKSTSHFGKAWARGSGARVPVNRVFFENWARGQGVSLARNTSHIEPCVFLQATATVLGCATNANYKQLHAMSMGSIEATPHARALGGRERRGRETK